MADARQVAPGFLAAVREVVGSAHCLEDPDVKASYETDWTRRYGGTSSVVIRPADTDEVAKVLAACSRFRVAVVPQGGNTGLVGGSVPRGGEAVLSLGRLDGVISCDADEALLVAEAGTTLAAAQRAAAEEHAELGIDIAARDSATLGGMVATNAGGVHVIRYGPMRARLGGVEVVLADGTVATRLSGLVKDNVGYDLAQIMAGSEGTLGVVTKVALHLVAIPRFRVAALVGLRGAGARRRSERRRSAPWRRWRSRWRRTSRRGVDGIDALELVFADGMALVRDRLAFPPRRTPARRPGSWWRPRGARTRARCSPRPSRTPRA